MTKYNLPKLKYEYDALEPYIDSKTIELHYTKHHQGYVDGLNKAIEGIEKARKNNDYSQVKHLKRELAFHYNGHILHTIYWNCMGPSKSVKQKPTGVLLEAIKQSFGSYENFVQEFKASTKAVEASGWGVLVLIERGLTILTIEKHQDLSVISAIPLMVCDVWEHAYYLKYQNKRAEYVDNFFNIIDWEYLEERYKLALKS